MLFFTRELDIVLSDLDVVCVARVLPPLDIGSVWCV